MFVHFTHTKEHKSLWSSNTYKCACLQSLLCLSVCLPAWLAGCPSVCLSVCLSACLSVLCVSDCWCLSIFCLAPCLSRFSPVHSGSQVILAQVGFCFHDVQACGPEGAIASSAATLESGAATTNPDAERRLCQLPAKNIECPVQ